MAVSHVKSDTIADFTGTFTGFNSQGSTTTIAATDVVRPSDWNSAHNQFYTLTGNTTGNSTASGTNVIFAGSGAISVGGSTGTIIFSSPVQSNQTGAVYASSNTTGASSSSTYDARSLTIVGSDNISLGWTNGSLMFKAAAGGGAESNWFTLAGDNTAGNTTASGSSIMLSVQGPLTISGTNNSQIKISAPATSSLVGTDGISISTAGSTVSIGRAHGSYFANMPYAFNSQTQQMRQSTSVVFPFDLKEIEDVGYAQFPATVNLVSTSFASTANTSYSYNQAETHNIVLYTRGVAGSSQSLQSVYSTSVGLTMSIRLSRNTTNNISVTHGFTYPVSNGTSSQSFSYAATNSSDQFSTTHLTAFTGIRFLDTQISTTLQDKIFWMAYGVSTTQTTQQTANLSAARLQYSNHGMSLPNVTYNLFGIAANASVQARPGLGSFSTAGGGTTASIPLSAISSSSSHIVPVLQLFSVG
jgi:hypothetical protein